MNPYFLYFVSLWGLFIIIGCIINIYYKNINDKNKYIIYVWLLFGIMGFAVHLYMHKTRNNPNVDIAKSISKSGGNFHPSTSLKICSLSQLFIISIYFYTREYFKIKWHADIFVILIFLTMFMRFIVLIYNGFKYTEQLLFTVK